MLVGSKAVPVLGKCLACCRHSGDDCGTGVTSQLCTSHLLLSSPGSTMRRAWKALCVCANLRLWVQWIRAPSRLARERRGGWLGGGMVGVLFSQDSRQGFQAPPQRPPWDTGSIWISWSTPTIHAATGMTQSQSAPTVRGFDRPCRGLPTRGCPSVSSRHPPTGHKGQ